MDTVKALLRLIRSKMGVTTRGRQQARLDLIADSITAPAHKLERIVSLLTFDEASHHESIFSKNEWGHRQRTSDRWPFCSGRPGKL
jgi:hypothetical protein